MKRVNFFETQCSFLISYVCPVFVFDVTCEHDYCVSVCSLSVVVQCLSSVYLCLLLFKFKLFLKLEKALCFDHETSSSYFTFICSIIMSITSKQ